MSERRRDVLGFALVLAALLPGVYFGWPWILGGVLTGAASVFAADIIWNRP